MKTLFCELLFQAKMASGTRRNSRPGEKGKIQTIGLFQCSECNNPCEEEGSGGKGGDSIECYSCQIWTHVKCTKLAKSHIDLLKTGGDQIQFTCKKCTPGKGSARQDPTQTKLNEILRLLEKQEKRILELEKINQISNDLTPDSLNKKIEDAVEKKLNEMQEEHEDKVRRMKNIIISNIEECTDNDREVRKQADLAKVRAKLEEISTGLGSEVSQPVRLGRYEAGKPPRPIKVVVKSTHGKTFILANARKIKQTETDNRKKVWINADQTKKERDAARALRDELKRRREAGEEDIVIRGDRIVKRTRIENTNETNGEAQTAEGSAPPNEGGPDPTH